MFVMVTGLPGSGKTTVAGPLAVALGLPFLSKDLIKEALWDALGPSNRDWGDRDWGRRLGTAAAIALESLAWSSPGAVIDHFVHTDTAHLWSTLPAVVEVHCACDPAISRARYDERRRHPCHFDADQLADSYDRWIAEDASRPPLAARLDVDTADHVDITVIADWVRTQWGASGDDRR